MRRGEVWWYRHPRHKPRPVCILTRAEGIPVLSGLVVAPATTKRRGIRTEVPLDVDDGMPKPCVLSLDNLRTVPKTMLVEHITTLPFARMEQVCQALAIATGC